MEGQQRHPGTDGAGARKQTGATIRSPLFCQSWLLVAEDADDRLAFAFSSEAAIGELDTSNYSQRSGEIDDPAATVVLENKTGDG